ncbi:MAG TPA: hypothetical protein VFS17_02765 [Methylophilaceae bacterium]|nr:hypothetical protein [Methylophilaceae bacterium]
MSVLLPRLSAFILLLAVPVAQALAQPCLTAEKLERLQLDETAYMLDRIPPAFKHAYEDQLIKLQMASSEPEENGSCSATLNMSLPTDDINEAQQLLEKDPAKRIVLFSQGYTLPETPQLSASFKVDPESLEIARQDTLQTSELGKLRASVEMMYALLTQARTAAEDNPKPWTTGFIKDVVEACVGHHQDQSDALPACQCQADALSKHYAERTMENILYVQSNPYAQATGAIESFGKLRSEINQACKVGRTAMME